MLVTPNFTLSCKRNCHHGSIAYSFKSNIFWYNVLSYCNWNVCNDHNKGKMQCRNILQFCYDPIAIHHGASKRFHTYRFRLRPMFRQQFKRRCSQGRGHGSRKIFDDETKLPEKMWENFLKHSKNKECLNRYIVSNCQI